MVSSHVFLQSIHFSQNWMKSLFFRVKTIETISWWTSFQVVLVLRRRRLPPAVASATAVLFPALSDAAEPETNSEAGKRGGGKLRYTDYTTYGYDMIYMIYYMYECYIDDIWCICMVVYPHVYIYIYTHSKPEIDRQVGNLGIRRYIYIYIIYTILNKDATRSLFWGRKKRFDRRKASFPGWNKCF